MHTASERRPGRAKSAGLALALVSAVAFGGSGVAAKPLISAGFGSLQVVWLRAAGAALVMLPIAWRHRRLALRRPVLLAGYGLLGVAGVQACYFVAIARIPVGVALLVEYLGPALVLGWVRLVQRRPVSRAAALGVVLAVGGLSCVVEVWSGLGFDAVGLLFALAAACCQAAYFLLGDHGSGAGTDTPDPLGVIAYGILTGAALLTLVAHPWTLDWSKLGGSARMDGTQVPNALLVCWLVLLATVLAYGSGILAVRRLSPQVAGVVAFLEAVVATVLAWFLLGEHLGAPQLIGGVAVLAGAFVAQSATPARAPAAPVTRGRPEAAGTPQPAGPLPAAPAPTELPDPPTPRGHQM
ncbi:DMT family transporter [Streptomyces sp. TS71-3]|uniref:EamA family transporter n=1 Tax=Streptomyces sp. TS71-3 TaxID=2733862 RepID=UPI001B03ACDE|nr:EamA family transporter [Streptomyces sp. TS71-3]GHJ39030.1 membrane protein [Streptomyces sp. TS71-3]